MNEQKKKEAEPVLTCEDLHPLLFDYMTRELGEGRSDVIREHLRKCEKCQAEAAEIQATLELLGKASRDAGPSGRLTDARRARIVRAMLHPVLDWVYVHHILVSILVTLLALAAILWAVKDLKFWERIDFSSAIPVTIGKGKPPEPDPLIEPQEIKEPEKTDPLPEIPEAGTSAVPRATEAATPAAQAAWSTGS